MYYVYLPPVEEVEYEEEERRAVEEEPVDLGVLVVPRGVVLVENGLAPLSLQAVVAVAATRG